MLGIGRRLEDEMACTAIVEALGRIGDRQAIPALTASLGRSTALSNTASKALHDMGPRRSRRSEAQRRTAQAQRPTMRDDPSLHLEKAEP